MACDADLRVPLRKTMLHSRAHCLKLTLARCLTEPLLRASRELRRINQRVVFAAMKHTEQELCQWFSGLLYLAE
jgi:hypothetical protein